MPQIPILPYIRSGITQKQSANAIYRTIQAAAREQSSLTGERWTGVNRQSFFRLYGETLSLRQAVGSAMEAPKDRIPDATDINTRSLRHGQGYLQWATVFIRQPGQTDTEPIFHAIRSDNPLTPAEVEMQAQQVVQNATQQAHGTLAGYVFQGAVYTGTERLLPPES